MHLDDPVEIDIVVPNCLRGRRDVFDDRAFDGILPTPTAHQWRRGLLRGGLQHTDLIRTVGSYCRAEELECLALGCTAVQIERDEVR